MLAVASNILALTMRGLQRDKEDASTNHENAYRETRRTRPQTMRMLTERQGGRVHKHMRMLTERQGGRIHKPWECPQRNKEDASTNHENAYRETRRTRPQTMRMLAERQGGRVHKPWGCLQRDKEDASTYLEDACRETRRTRPQTMKMLAETVRMCPQTLRMLAATVRTRPQTVRMLAESERTRPKIIRMLAETVRTRPQTVRMLAESVRMCPQTMRMLAETVRTRRQTMRMLAETVRTRPQTIRMLAETVRTCPQTVRMLAMSVRTHPQTMRMLLDTVRILFMLFHNACSGLEHSCIDSERLAERQGGRVHKPWGCWQRSWDSFIVHSVVNASKTMRGFWLCLHFFQKPYDSCRGCGVRMIMYRCCGCCRGHSSAFGYCILKVFNYREISL